MTIQQLLHTQTVRDDRAKQCRPVSLYKAYNKYKAGWQVGSTLSKDFLNILYLMMNQLMKSPRWRKTETSCHKSSDVFGDPDAA
jgi:hypothetical protein